MIVDWFTSKNNQITLSPYFVLLFCNSLRFVSFRDEIWDTSSEKLQISKRRRRRDWFGTSVTMATKGSNAGMHANHYYSTDTIGQPDEAVPEAIFSYWYPYLFPFDPN